MPALTFLFLMVASHAFTKTLAAPQTGNPPCRGSLCTPSKNDWKPIDSSGPIGINADQPLGATSHNRIEVGHGTSGRGRDLSSPIENSGVLIAAAAPGRALEADQGMRYESYRTHDWLAPADRAKWEPNCEDDEYELCCEGLNAFQCVEYRTAYWHKLCSDAGKFLCCNKFHLLPTMGPRGSLKLGVGQQCRGGSAVMKIPPGPQGGNGNGHGKGNVKGGYGRRIWPTYHNPNLNLPNRVRVPVQREFGWQNKSGQGSGMPRIEIPGSGIFKEPAGRL